MTGRMDGRVALVTGAGSGIGRGCALAFARAGATVIAADLSQRGLDATREEAGALQLHYAPPTDLTDEAAVGAMVEAVGAEHGRIDALVNAAANAAFKWIEEMTYADWRMTITAELDTVFLVTRAAWPLLKASGRAAVVNFASANAYHALPGSAALAHCAGKGGVLAMTRQLAMEGAPHGIRANTISPGMIVTGATAPVLEQPGFKETVMEGNMIKRLGQPEDIGMTATFLCSDEAGYITGADFRVDAGATAW